MDPRDLIERHNKPLDESMLDQGYELTTRNGRKFYATPEGQYIGYPPWYVTGPQRGASNGNPNPWYCSIKLPEGTWAQRSFSTADKAADWAVGYLTGKGVLNAHPEKSDENTKCLAGIRCPECGQNDKFYIVGLVKLEITDEGVQVADSKNFNWGVDSHITCAVCGKTGWVGETFTE